MPERTPILTTVQDVSWLTPRMARIVLGGEALEGFGAGAFTDHYVKLLFPPAGAPYAAPFDPAAIKAELPREQWPRTRTYTVRDWDAERRRLTIDFVVHGDTGLAGPWAASARPGDRLQLFGPGGAYAPDPGGRLAPDGRRRERAAGDRRLARARARGRARDRPLRGRRAGGPARARDAGRPRPALGADREPLIDALRALELPRGRGPVLRPRRGDAVRDARRHLLVERGLDREALSVSGYWKRTRTEEGWREDKAEWLRQAELDTAAA